MAVSGKTAAPSEIPYLEESDIPDVALGDKVQAERIAAILEAAGYQPLSWLKSGSKGQIVICNKSGVPQYVTASGDVTNDESGVLTIADHAVTSRKAKLTAGVVAATKTLKLSESGVFKDVPGAVLEITPAVPSLLLVTAVFQFDPTSGGPESRGEAFGTVKLDAEADDPAQAIFGWETLETEGQGTRSQVYSLPLTAAAHTIKLRAKVGEKGGLVTVQPEGTRFLYTLLAS